VLVQEESSGLWVPSEKSLLVSKDEGLLESREVSAPPGVVILRINEALIFPNASYLAQEIQKAVSRQAYIPKRCTQSSNEKQNSLQVVVDKERLWCDRASVALCKETNGSTPPGSIIEEAFEEKEGEHILKTLPRLKAVIFDFSSVNLIDFTALQMLADLQKDLDSFCGQVIPFHFAHVDTRSCFRKMIYFIENMSLVGKTSNLRDLKDKKGGSHSAKKTKTSIHSLVMEPLDSCVTVDNGPVAYPKRSTSLGRPQNPKRAAVFYSDYIHENINSAIESILAREDKLSMSEVLP
jgi:MFS superfamily sulfate permease-like transporter